MTEVYDSSHERDVEDDEPDGHVFFSASLLFCLLQEKLLELLAEEVGHGDYVDDDRQGCFPAEVGEHYLCRQVELVRRSYHEYGRSSEVRQRATDGYIDEEHTESGVHETLAHALVVVAFLE